MNEWIFFFFLFYGFLVLNCSKAFVPLSRSKTSTGVAMFLECKFYLFMNYKRDEDDADRPGMKGERQHSYQTRQTTKQHKNRNEPAKLKRHRGGMLSHASTNRSTPAQWDDAELNVGICVYSAVNTARLLDARGHLLFLSAHKLTPTRMRPGETQPGEGRLVQHRRERSIAVVCPLRPLRARPVEMRTVTRVQYRGGPTS